MRDVAQWEQGWSDCDEDLRRGDLPEVTDWDFRNLPKY